MGLRVLLSCGAAFLVLALASALPQESRQNLTNLRERLPQMVAELGAMTYEEFSDETSKSVETSSSASSSTAPKQLFKRLVSAEEGVEYQNYQGVMGRPGVDFPVLPSIPRTDFTCKKVKNSGYYADLDTDCQVFHICDQGRKISFLCPNGTIFRQSHLICDWWWTVDCAGSVDLYESSAETLANDQRISRERSNKQATDAELRRRADASTTTTTEVPVRARGPAAPAQRQSKQFVDNQSPTSTSRPRGSGKNYNNIRNNYGTTAAADERQVPAESASFVNNKNNQFRQNQYVQQNTFDNPSTTTAARPEPSSTRAYAQVERVRPPLSPSANQPSFRQIGDEDVFSNRGRGPPSRDFYKSTSTEAVPITDVVQPSGNPFTAEEVTKQPLSIANSKKVKPVYVHVTTREGRLATSPTPPSITDVVSPSGKPFTDEDELAKALATLGPHLKINYLTTTTELPPITDVVQPAGVPFRDEDFGTYKPFVPPEPEKPADTELPPFTEPPTEQPPTTTDVHQEPGEDDITVIAFTTTTSESPPINDVFKSDGPEFKREDESPPQDLIAPVRREELPPIFDIVRPTGNPFTFEDDFAAERHNNGLESASLVTETPVSKETKPKSPTTFVEFDRVNKELKFVTTEANPDVKLRADELHSALDDIVHGKSLSVAFIETLKTAPDERRRTPFADVRPGPPSPTTFDRTSGQRSFKDNVPVTTSLPPSTSYQPLYTTLQPPEIDDNDISSPNNNSLALEDSHRDVVTEEPDNDVNDVHVGGDRTGLEIPTSSGPAVLHSLAVYFGDRSELAATTPTTPEQSRQQPSVPEYIRQQSSTTNNRQQPIIPNFSRQQSTMPDRSRQELNNFLNNRQQPSTPEPIRQQSTTPEPTTQKPTIPEDHSKDEILQPAFATYPEPTLGIQTITDDQLSGAAPSLLTQFTKDSYEALFPETVKDKSSESNSGDEILQRQGSNANSLNDLNYNLTAEDVALKKSVDTADLRELAQVFSRALSAYLEDPEEFRKVLSEVRPTPPSDIVDNKTLSATTSAYSDREEDEVLEYSDDIKPHKRPLQKLFTKPDKNYVDRKAKVISAQDLSRLPAETLVKSPSAYYSESQQRFSGNQLNVELPTEQQNVDESLTDYNLPPGSVQYRGPGYGPQPGERRGKDEETTTTEIPTTTAYIASTTPYIASTTPQPETTTFPAEFTTYQPVNSYDGYIIPVLNTDLTPPFEPEYSQNSELESLAGSFKPEDLNNLAVVVPDVPATTEDPPTTTEEATTAIPTSTEFIINILPREELTTTTTTQPQTVRLNAKDDRQGRRLSPSRSPEAGETLVRANSASFTSSRYKESGNQWNIIGRLESIADVKHDTTTSRPATSRPVVRRRFKTTTEVTSELPVVKNQPEPTNPPVFESTTVITTPSITVVERRPSTTTRPPPVPVQSATIKPPSFQRKAKPSLVKSDKIVYGTKVQSDTNTPEPRRTSTNTPEPRRTGTNTPQPRQTGTNTLEPRRTGTNTPEPRRTSTNTHRRPDTITPESPRPDTNQPEFPRARSFPNPPEPRRNDFTPLPARARSFAPTYLPEPSTTPMPMEMEAMMMFGGLNASSMAHMMDIMKMAESNTTIRRLVLLLVNHGINSKSTEEARRNLIEALLTTPDEIPMPEALLGADTSSPRQPYNETTSMKVSMTVGTSSKTSTRKGKMLIGSSVRMTMNEAGKESTTTQVPVTTYRNNGKRVVYKATVPTTTKRPVEKKRTTPMMSTTMKVSVSTGNSTTTTTTKRVTKKTAAEQATTPSPLTQESDNRAVDLLRSLYSLAARWG